MAMLSQLVLWWGVKEAIFVCINTVQPKGPFLLFIAVEYLNEIETANYFTEIQLTWILFELVQQCLINTKAPAWKFLEYRDMAVAMRVVHLA